MKCLVILFAAFALVASTPAQETADLLQAGDQWIAENIDEEALDALGIDRNRTRDFLTNLQHRLQAEYVLDLALLRDMAKQILPVLDQYEETEPYAVWLRTHLDYFEVSEQLRKHSVVTNKTARPPNPEPQAQQSVWVKVIAERPLPRGAKESVPVLKKIFREERVPEELVWVAEVESSFNPGAKSPVGAAGLYQLMPATARSLDLSVGWFRDERFHAEKNARAAARYLRRLHQRFGNWRLALAAYNCGPTRVAGLLEARKATTFEAIAAKLPAETQMFVPKVEAVILKREGRRLDQLKAVK